MIETVVRISGEAIEQSLRVEMARADARADGVLPILRHLLAHDSSAMFGDEVIARVRGMQSHLVYQLLAGLQPSDADIAKVHQALTQNSQLLGHLHALALEWQLAKRLEQNFLIDPVVSQLVEACLSSDDPETRDIAVKLLAAQALWCQAQSRMQIGLGELPAELLDDALFALSLIDGKSAQRAEERLRTQYDEATSRLGLAARLVLRMGHDASGALDLRHGGIALFATALALGCAQTREQAIFSMVDTQMARFALGLRSAGLDMQAIEQQLLLLHGEVSLPDGFDEIAEERATVILSRKPEESR